MMPRFPLLLVLALVCLSAHAAIRATPERELSPRVIDSAASSQSGARIASDGDSFFTVWSDDQRTILGARLHPDGSLADEIPITISAPNGRPQDLPAIAWGIDRYLVAWRENGDSFRARLIAPDGTMSDIIELGFRPDRNVPEELHIAFNGRRFLVVWSENATEVRAVAVDPDGRVTASHTATIGFSHWINDLVAMQGTFYFVYAASGAVFVLPIDESANAGMPLEIAHSDAFGIRAAARDNEFLVGWWSSPPLANEISAVRVTAAGASAVETFAEGRVTLHDVVADRTGYLLFYGDNTNVRARRAGSATSFDLRTPPGFFKSVQDSASNGVKTMAIVQRGDDIFATVPSEDVLTPIALAPRSQAAPEIAAAGDLRLVVWREAATSVPETALMATRIDAEGRAVDPTPIRLAGVAAWPRVASNGSDWLVIWQLGGKLYGMRVRHDGTLADPAPFVIAEIATPLDESTAVAWDGTSYVVVWASGGVLRGGVFTALYAGRVPAEGSLATAFNPATAIRVNNNSQWNHFPAIAAGPNGCLIVWTENSSLRGALLSPGNTVTPLGLSGSSGRPSVAWNGDTFLVATGSSERGLRFVRVDASGNASDLITKIPFEWENATTEMAVQLEAFGDGFLVLYADPDLKAAVLNRQGDVIDGPTVVGETSGSPMFAASGGLFVTQHAIDHPTQTFRIFAQRIDWMPEVRPRRRSVRF